MNEPTRRKQRQGTGAGVGRTKAGTTGRPGTTGGAGESNYYRAGTKVARRRNEKN